MRTVCKHDACIQHNLQQRLDLLTMGRCCRTMWSCYKQTRLPTPPTLLPTSAIFTSSYLLDPLVRIPKVEGKRRAEEKKSEKISEKELAGPSALSGRPERPKRLACDLSAPARNDTRETV